MNNLIFKKTLVIPAILIGLLGYLITFSSCKKTNTENSYEIKGRILKNCNQDPLANYSLEIYGLTTFNGSKTLATTTTDPNGYFTFSNIAREDCADVYMKHIIDDNYVTTWAHFPVVPGLNEDLKVFELGDFYKNATVNTLAVLNINSSHYRSMDTLYIGFDLSSYQAEFPIPQKHVYLHSSNSSYFRAESIKPEIHINWGVGKSFWDSLHTPFSGIEFKDYTIIAKQSVCTYPDTTYYHIP